MNRNRRTAYIDNYEMRVEDWSFSKEQDFSPPDFWVFRDPNPWKDRLRKVVYPCLISLLNRKVRRRLSGMGIPQEWRLVWGARGQGGRYMVKRVNDIFRIRDTSVLLLGIGLGREIEFWTAYNPEKILGVDVLNFQRAWDVLKRDYSSLKLDFRKVQTNSLEGIADSSFNIISSENVFEHVTDLSSLLADCARVMRRGGLLFATFGPLWYSWSGDHFSGQIDGGHGFLHISGDYECYKKQARLIPFREGERADGRVWLLQDLFSFLRPIEYIEACSRYFRVTDVRAHVSPEAWDFRLRHSKEYAAICHRNNLEKWEPLIGGLEIAAFNMRN